MSAPSKQALTFNFSPSVSTATGIPNVLEIAVLPLNSSDGGSTTIAGGLQTATVELTYPGPNSVTFELIPSYASGLSEPIFYRVMWRIGVMGQTETHDFAMPDATLTWEALQAGPSEIVNPLLYILQAQMGVPLGVATLDVDGHVVDAAGDPVATNAAIDTVEADLIVETNARIAGDESVTSNLEAQLSTGLSTTLSTAESYANTHYSTLGSALSAETANRIDADAGLSALISNTAAGLQSQIDSVVVTTGGNVEALSLKADLVDGQLKASEIPPLAVSNITGLQATLNTFVTGTSLNAALDALTAADVGALALGASIDQDQVTGLTTALGLKADQSALATATGLITGILNDTTYVHTVAGKIPDAKLDSTLVYLTGDELVTGGGTVITVGGGGIGTVTSVNSVEPVDGNVTLTPSSIGAAPATGIAISAVTNLATTLSSLATVATLNATDAALDSLLSTVSGITAELSTFATTDAVNTALEAYATLTALGTTNAAITTINSTLSTLASESWVTTQLAGYATTTALSTAVSGLATQSWVTGLSYATTAALSSAVSGLASEAWVTAQNYAVAGTGGVATESWVTGLGYVTSTALAAALSDVTAASLGALTSASSIPTTQLTGTLTTAQLPSAIPISQITTLSTTLATFATTTAVQGLLYTSSMVKRADYVATSAVTAGGSGAPAGLQLVDGITMPVGARVLVTAQPSSVNNGIWVTTTTAWTRPPDFFTNNWLAQDSVVIVTNETGSSPGGAYNNTIWQATAASGVIDTAANNWTRIGWSAPPFTPVQGNGITITGSTFAAKVVSGGGVLSGGTGLSVDSNVVARKYIGAVPSGSTLATIPHNLNSNYPVVSIWRTGDNALVLAGITVVDANHVQIEFGSTVTAGEYQVVVHA